MVPAVIVVIHESPDVLFKVSGKIVVFEQDPSWPALSKWSNPNVRIGFGFKRRHAALPL